MIPRLKPCLGITELIAAVKITGRDDVAAFEASFANLMGQKYAVAFPYGRTGLIILLKALGLENKEIICPAYTCVVVPHAIVYSGNQPVFIDCAPGEFNMDLNRAEQAITPNTGAIIATSLFGYPVDLDRLNQIKKKYPGVYIIQDCAHSFAADWKGRPVQKEGVAAIFGLNISKLLTSIFGGMVTTDSTSLCQDLKSLRKRLLTKPTWKKSLRRLLYLLTVYPSFCGPVYGLLNKLERSGCLNHFVKYYDDSVIDMPKDYLEEMTKLEARVGMANIRRYHYIIQNRREAADAYFENLEIKNSNGSQTYFDEDNYKNKFDLPPKIKGATYSHFVVKTGDRDRWLMWGLRHGIQLGWLIEYNIPEMKAYSCRNPNEFPVAARYARETINLPVWGGKNLSKKILNQTTLITLRCSI